MRASPPTPLRLVACDGHLLDPEPPAGRDGGSIDLTVLEISPGRVVCLGEGAGATSEHVYAALAEESLRLAARSLLAPLETQVTVRVHLEPLSHPRHSGPLEAAALAVRLGPRAVTATVTVSAGGLALARGGLVSVVQPGARARSTTLHAV